MSAWLSAFSMSAKTVIEIDSKPKIVSIFSSAPPAGALMSPQEYDRIQEPESAQFMAAANRGFKDADETKFRKSFQADSGFEQRTPMSKQLRSLL